MIHLHLEIKESTKGKIDISISREVTKTETKNEISAASTIIKFVSSPKDFIQFSDPEKEQQKDPSDWWKDEGGEPFKRN